MDYTSIINLALVTILYSTFISPNITKLSKIKEDVLNLEFPSTVSSDSDIDAIKKNRVKLVKKVAQYSAKYYEIINFLKYFYFIVGLLIAYQIFRLFFVQTLDLEKVVLVLSSVIVILIVIISVNKYISHPYLIRSLGWLTRGGIAPIYLKHMYNAKLSVGIMSRNSDLSSKNDIPIAIRSDVGFCGYNYIVTVESPDSNKLYYVAAGKTGKNHSPSTLVFDNGRQGSEILLAAPKLDAGSYIIRLLFNGAFFSGGQPVYETLLDISVDKNGAVSQKAEQMNIGDGSESGKYRFVLNTKRRIDSVLIVRGDLSDSAATEMLLDHQPFLNAIKNSKRSIVISNEGRQIDSGLLKLRTQKLSLIKSKTSRLFKRKSERTLSFHL